MIGIERIAAERKRQVEEEGWTPEHDDQHNPEDLERAAACYAAPPSTIYFVRRPVGGSSEFYDSVYVPRDWPFDAEWWKPTPGNRERDLEKAGALLAAALDLRMRRAGSRENSEVLP